MRLFLKFAYFFCLLGGFSFGEEIKVIAAPAGAVGEAWLGIKLSKPDDAMASQLPVLPPGIGFVVTDLTKGGPAAKAGVLKNDLLWKMNEQMLVNEGQLATLLRLASPGDQAMISLFREGKSVDLEVVLGEQSISEEEVARMSLVEMVMRADDGAVRIVNQGDKTAMISNERGSAEVGRVKEGDAVKIVNKDGEIVFEAVLKGCWDHSLVPEDWKVQVCTLRKALDHALSVKAAPERQPRPRIVPPAPPEPQVMNKK